MKFKEYVKELNKLIEKNPEYSNLEVYKASDDEWNSLLPSSIDEAVVYVPCYSYETDEYIVEQDFDEDYELDEYKKVLVL